ncbi:3'-5' exonuclease family protein [Corynebacterium deserti]|uniref:hypothetical protein n=1 Tax=Corynebacterium deserti TaxID=1408191 RepID=UPI001E6329E3|nr:hypothetical protein [Corynebacterium deserti]
MVFAQMMLPMHLRGDIYSKVAEFIGDLPLSAHNFGFDGSVLTQLAELYQHEPVTNPRYCTLR